MMEAYAILVMSLMIGVMVTAVVELSNELAGFQMPALIAVRKVGGLYFWRVGKIGGSFYVASK